MHLRHYLHSTLDVSWLVDLEQPSIISALLGISLGRQRMAISLQNPAGLSGLVDPISGSVGRVLDRLKTAIGELGYEAVIEDLRSPELIGGEDSLLGSEDVMVIPGHLADSAADRARRVEGVEWQGDSVICEGHSAGQNEAHRSPRNNPGRDRFLRLLGLGVVSRGTSRGTECPQPERRPLRFRHSRGSRPRSRADSR